MDDGTSRLDFATLERRSRELAGGWAGRGLGSGERVAVVASNCCEYVELYLALSRAGAVIVPVNWRLRASELTHVLVDSGAVAVVVSEELRATLEGCRADCPAVREWVALGAASPGWIRYEALFGEGDAAALGDAVDEADVAVQMYTSGTTGAPKGAMLTHRNVTAMTLAWLIEIGLGPAPDRFLQVTPLFHVGGMLQLASTVAAGATLRLLPEFLPAPALDVLEREAITHALFVPAMVQWLLGERSLAERRFPHLRLIIYGAAPMPVATLTRAMDAFGCGFLQGYGLTETSGVVTSLRPADHRFDPSGPVPARLASAGRAVLGCEVRVVDAGGRDVAHGEVGEVVVRGDQVGPGYWRRPEATAESFVDGWFHTGDLATLDEEGYVTIVDRLKDMILVAGENVYPGEVEEALRSHPSVEDVAVIGVPHELWGEEVLALVVGAEGAEVNERVLIQHARGLLARFKCPTRVERTAELPRNAAGKLLKRELREGYWRGRERRV